MDYSVVLPEFEETLNNILKEKEYVNYGIIVKHNIENVLRFLFKKSIVITKIRNITDNVTLTSLGINVDTTQTPINLSYYINSHTDAFITFGKDGLRDDVKLFDDTSECELSTTDLLHTFKVKYVLNDHRIEMGDDFFVILPRENTLQGLKDLQYLMTLMKDDGRLPKDAEINSFDPN